MESGTAGKKPLLKGRLSSIKQAEHTAKMPEVRSISREKGAQCQKKKQKETD
jgi:hypothetical protein